MLFLHKAFGIRYATFGPYKFESKDHGKTFVHVTPKGVRVTVRPSKTLKDWPAHVGFTTIDETQAEPGWCVAHINGHDYNYVPAKNEMCDGLYSAMSFAYKSDKPLHLEWKEF